MFAETNFDSDSDCNRNCTEQPRGRRLLRRAPLLTGLAARGEQRRAVRYFEMTGLKPPQNIRLPSKGRALGSKLALGSDITCFMILLRSALVL